MRIRLRVVESPKEIIDPIDRWSFSEGGENYYEGLFLNVICRWMKRILLG